MAKWRARGQPGLSEVSLSHQTCHWMIRVHPWGQPAVHCLQWFPPHCPLPPTSVPPYCPPQPPTHLPELLFSVSLSHGTLQEDGHSYGEKATTKSRTDSQERPARSLCRPGGLWGFSEGLGSTGWSAGGLLRQHKGPRVSQHRAHRTGLCPGGGGG